MSKKKVIISSKNPVKIASVYRAFKKMFPGVDFIFEGVSVDSGVSNQPVGDAETFKGAYQRANNAKLLIHKANYWVGIEGGIANFDNETGTFAWIYIIGENKTGKSRTTTFMLPPPVTKLLNDGYELGDADDIVFGKTNSKQENGASGLLSGNIVTRTDLYEQAVVLALVAFRKPYSKLYV